MSDQRVRYNSGIQRSKGLLEIAAALYDTSLSRVITRGGNIVPQTDSRLGSRLSIQIEAPPARFRDDGIGLQISSGGGVRQALMRVARKEVSMIWLNPSAVLTMAVRGTGPFTEPQPLRTIGVFPSWDSVVFAVHESTGITSFDELFNYRKPLRLSTRETITPPFDDHATMFAVSRILAEGGCSLDRIREWGGTIQSVPRPSHPNRSDAIKAGALDAVFDEGVLSWGQFALDNGFRILPIEGSLAKRARELGYPLTTLTASRIPGLVGGVPSINFSGWPLVVHTDMADDVAYAFCEAIELRKDAIPTDNYKPVDIVELCSGGEETPRDVPLHPGAERFYRERGHLGATGSLR